MRTNEKSGRRDEREEEIESRPPTTDTEERRFKWLLSKRFVEVPCYGNLADECGSPCVGAKREPRKEPDNCISKVFGVNGVAKRPQIRVDPIQRTGDCLDTSRAQIEPGRKRGEVFTLAGGRGKAEKEGSRGICWVGRGQETTHRQAAEVISDAFVWESVANLTTTGYPAESRN